jgi:hypothetical protein
VVLSRKPPGQWNLEETVRKGKMQLKIRGKEKEKK